MKDRHKGETCIVIASGPSLKDVPNEFLESYVTFGVNKIWLKGFSPTYYMAIDPWMNPYTRQMRDMRCKDCFLKRSFLRDIPEGHVRGIVLRDTPEIEWGIEKDGGTVIYPCLQLAHHMGFETVLLVGLDHTGDATYFHKDYNIWVAKKEYRWAGELVDTAFRVAREKYEESGRRIINLTPDSKCDVFEKQDIELWQTHT